MKKLSGKFLLGSAILLGALASSSVAFAADSNNTGQNEILDQCQYLPLATNLAFPKKFGTKNTTVCVDIPVQVEKAKMVFNMDTDTVDGKGNSNGLKHMLMMGSVMKEQIAKGLIKPENVDIIGIMHGSALKWLVKPVPPQQKKFIEGIFKLKREGVNIHIEACAAAMNGAHLTKKNLFSYDANGNPDPKAGGRIYVNQGAFARELYLENHGYAYFEEGYDYHGKK
jgi:intracellular sulfur oxidation DsrE/DsrF family protein